MNTPEMIIDSSGEGCKVWKSEVLDPGVIVDTGSFDFWRGFIQSWRHGQ